MNRFTEAEQRWIREALARRNPPTADQLDTIRAAFRRAAHNRPSHTAA